jgi:hypothetical protein
MAAMWIAHYRRAGTRALRHVVADRLDEQIRAEAGSIAERGDVIDTVTAQHLSYL